MFQFPPSPAVGQEFSPIPGITYRWNGTAWFLTQSDAVLDLRYVRLAQYAAAGQLLIGGALPGAPVPLAPGADGTVLTANSALPGKVGYAAVPSPLALLVGSIVYRHSVGVGMLHANGQVVSKTTYAALWAYAQGFLGAQPGQYRNIDAATFGLPKLDGFFIRSLGTADATHISAPLGVGQVDDFNSHAHVDAGHGHVDGGHQHAQIANNAVTQQSVTVTGPSVGTGYATSGGGGAGIVTSSANANILGGVANIQAAGGAGGGIETRPMNIALVPCILTGKDS